GAGAAGGRPRRGRIGVLRVDRGPARCRGRRARGGARPAVAPGRQRLERAGALDRHRGPHLRLAHLPHQQRARVGVRQPLRRVQRLRPPRVDGAPRTRLPDAHRHGDDDAVLRPAPHARAGAGAGPGAGGRAGRRDPGQPRGEGDQPDRAAAVRGVHPRLHRQAVADRPPRPAGADHHAPAGALHVRDALLHRHARGHPGRRLRRAAHPHGDGPGRDGPHRRRLVRRPRPAAGRHPGGLHRPGRPLVRLPRRRAGLAHPRPRDRGPRGRRPPGHDRHELRRRGRRAHPRARVPALPPRAPTGARSHRRDDRVLPLGAARGRALLPGRHAGGPAPPQGLPRAHGARAGRPLRRSPRELPVPRHAHGHRRGAHGVRQRHPPSRAPGSGGGL
ncbi:MAG: UDP-galactopyranose mutase, partial [uncultured Frankineae bacterium]